MINEILEQIKKQIKVFENKTAEEEKIYKLYLNARKSIVNKEINYQLLSPTDFMIISLVNDDISRFSSIKKNLEVLRPLLDNINKEDAVELIILLDKISEKDKNQEKIIKELEKIIKKYNNLINIDEIINIDKIINIILKYLYEYKIKFICEIMLFCKIKHQPNHYANPSEIVLYNEEIQCIDRNINVIIRTKKHKIKEMKKQKEKYEDSIKIIEKYRDKKDIITDYKPLLLYIQKESILRKILLFINNHNRSLQNELEKKYISKKNNSKYNYITLLSNYNIEKEEINLEKIINLDYEDMKQILNQLSKYFCNKEIIIKCIENTSSINSFNIIIELIKNGIIEKTILINYPELLDENSKEYKSLIRNYQFLKSEGINPMAFKNSSEAIINNNFLERNIKILKEYNLLGYMKNGANLNFLNNPGLVEKIDILLELGLENELEKNLEVLNNENIKRLIVLNSIGILPYEIDKIYEIIEKSKFKIPDNELDNYIINDTIYYQNECEEQTNPEEISELYFYTSSNRVYEIDGIIISKNRVKRYYSRNSEDKIEALFQAIIHNTVLTEEEIQRIKSALNKNIKRK